VKILQFLSQDISGMEKETVKFQVWNTLKYLEPNEESARI
jgi:hypothetical protein